KNNLKQIGLALHNYHETFNTIPPGWVEDLTATNAQTWWGWTSQMLPQLDQAGLYGHLNFLQCWTVDTVYTPSKLPILLCPSDPVGALNFQPTGGTFTTQFYGRSNYPGIAGAIQFGPLQTTWVTATLNPPAGGGGGSFSVNSKHNFRDFNDGLSNSA